MSNVDASTGVYSCDDHLDLSAVPPDLWESRLPTGQAERGPRVIDRDGRLIWMAEDRMIGRSGIAATTSETARKLSAIGRAGIDDDGYRASNPKLRLEDMERDGLWASVIYGPLAVGLPIRDPDLQNGVYAAWNDWAVEDFSAVAPDRLSVLAFLPGHSPIAAAAELERCAEIGHRGAILDMFDVDLTDPEWDRLWSAADSTGLPISFHIVGGTSSKLSYQLGKWQSAAYASVLPLQLDEPLAIMIFSGALERHPGLKIVLAESGIGWLPYFLARMDLEWGELRDKVDYAPAISPSELFTNQVMATFEEDALAAEMIPLLGAGSCMWASDYPHTDSTFPHSLDAIEETLGALSDDDRRKIVATNCAQLYGFTR